MKRTEPEQVREGGSRIVKPPQEKKSAMKREDSSNGPADPPGSDPGKD